MVGFERTEILVDEFDQEVSVHVVVLQGLAERRFSMDVHTLEGTAAEGFNTQINFLYLMGVIFTGADFFPPTKTLIFEPFQMNQTVVFKIIYDNIRELNEQFSLMLVSNDTDVIIQDGRSTLQITIADQTGKLWSMCYFFYLDPIIFVSKTIVVATIS